jgi:ABC-type lipoprotein release transport system permease subunit
MKYRRWNPLILGWLETLRRNLVCGIIAYVANQRTKEIGIHMALGAQVKHVVWPVLKQGMVLIFSGVALGVLSSSASTRLIEGMLYGVSPMDQSALLGAAFLLTVVALLVCYLPRQPRFPS